MKLRWLLMGLGIWAIPAALWGSSPGTSGGAVLNIPVGARAIGMGEAYTALADDVSSLYWNPAGMAILNQSQASFMYNQFLRDLSYHNAAVAIPWEYGGFGASLSYLSYGKINGYDPAGTPTGDVNAYSSVGTLGAAMLGEWWSAGANIKGVQESLSDVKATGIAADFGVTAVYPNELLTGTLRTSAVLRNVGTGLKFIDQTDPFPRQWRIGLAMVQMMNRKLSVSVDYGQERNINGSIYAGAEYWALPYIALRTGYAGSHTESNGLRAGVGLKFKDISFDYAYGDYGVLGMTHRYELTVRFGPIVPRLTPEERRMLRRAKVAMAQGRNGEATQLLDALIQMEPKYRPFRRLIKVAMKGYEKDEKLYEKMHTFSNLQLKQAAKSPTNEEAAEIKELEALLNMGDNPYAERK